MDGAIFNLISVSLTILSAVIAYKIYFDQKADNKKNSARIIIQEIRRAEAIISDYKRTGGYQFDRKIIATNSWTKNIHLFVGNFDNDELDKISDLYSTGEYLDSLIKEISQIKLNDAIEREKKRLEVSLQYETQHAPQLDGSTYPMAQISQPIVINVTAIAPVWNSILDTISRMLEPIYYSEIVKKFKKIAKID